MHFVLRMLREGVLIYCVIICLMYYFQDSLIFVGSTMPNQPIEGLPEGLTVEWMDQGTTSSRVVVGMPEEKVKGVIVFFGGNGETIGALLHRCYEFKAYGFMVLAPEPPGYGLSPGPMGVEATMLTADVAGDLAISKARELGVPVVAIGSSIGTFSALHLAANNIASRVLLHAPLTSLAEVASRLYWWLPVNYLLHDHLRYDSAGDLAALVHLQEPPVLVIHGEQDEIVPMEVGARVCATLGDQCQFLGIKGAHHNDIRLDADGPLGDFIARFLDIHHQ